MMTEREKAIYCLALSTWDADTAATLAEVGMKLTPEFVKAVLSDITPELLEYEALRRKRG